MTLILGFGNKARHGKDSAAQAITHYYASKPLHIGQRPLKVETFKYAAALYVEVNEFLAAFPGPTWENVTLYGDNTSVQLPEWVRPDPMAEKSALAPYGKHPKLLQWWGTEYRRAQDTDYWVKKMFASIPSGLDIAMITDVRFPNEFYAIKKRNGYTIRVTRGNYDGRPYVSEDRPADHPSETALDSFNWDFEIDSPAGHAVLAGEIAITIAEYLRGRRNPEPC